MDLERLSIDESNVKALLDSGKSYRYISSYLQSLYPDARGLSERSVRRYCAKHGIYRVSGPELDFHVSNAVQELGPAYGVKTMSGYLDSKGVKVGRIRLRNSLKRASPVYYERRRNDTVRQTNPVPYYASYFGNKLHVDQNEKLVSFGVTHVLFIDGYSRKILKTLTLPIKNPIAIYRVYREILLEYGLWDMVRIDHGQEFCLVNFIQNTLRDHRNFQHCPPYVQTPSRENLRVERTWPEVNQRVNYSIKQLLINMQSQQIINMYDDTEKFCVSYITCKVAEVGVRRFVAAWNRHPIEGLNSKVPDFLAETNSNIAHVTVDVVPTVEDAVSMYEAAGGRLTRESCFGVDPIRTDHTKIANREHLYQQQDLSFEYIFGCLVNGNYTPFETAISAFINITRSLV